MSRELTIVLPFFQNLGMLAEHQRVWADYPGALRSRVHVVVVDDCSPKGHRPNRKSVTVDGLASFRILRLVEKKRWNWLACRNLGAKVAMTDWLLLTDIDHVLPASTLRHVLEGALRHDDAYKFARVTATQRWPYDVSTLPPYKPHNDSWLLTKSMFFHKRVMGYDERLSGCYGTSGEFTDRVRSAARAIVAQPYVLIRYPREVIADASTHPSVYTRKNDPANDAELQQRKAARALISHWKPLHGLIRHEVVYDSQAVAAAVA